MPRPDYDSGWFAMNDDTSTTLTHNLDLSSGPCILSQVFVSGNSSPTIGTNFIAVNPFTKHSGVLLEYKTKDTIEVHTDEYIYHNAGHGSPDGNADIDASGAVRVLLWK